MTNLRTKLQDFSQKYIFLFLAVYIICQPLLDVLTGLGAQAGHSVTAGVVVRSLFMVLAFLYAVFVSDFPGKKRWMMFTGALCAYLVLFMGYMFSLGGLSLCISNIREMVKTFFVPFVLVFLWAVYKQYNCLAGWRVIALAGALYASVIPIAVLTRTSFISYGNSGEGYRGWFYAANEVGCIIALTAPFTIAWCLEVLPTVTRQTWWKGALCVWSLVGIAVTANFLGTKIVFGAVALYCVAAFIWQVVMLVREPGRVRKIQAIAMGGMLLLTLGIFFLNSPLLSYLVHIYIPLIDNEPDITLASWGEEIQAAAKGSWLHTLLNSNETLERIDQILSRRLLSSAPAVQVYTEGGVLTKLLGIGYAKAPSYSREMYFMVEMDPLALLIRHGVVGFLLYYIPYLGFLGWSVVQFFKRPALRLSSLSCCTALYCTLVGFGISTIAGHALVSPAVATFILVVGLALYHEYRLQDHAPQDNEVI
ncbi:MAG: O-antigen ligase family protein [Muribaculaceae bacterium]|nr:O-antigen ligase family protein [Muribaculaceae bacterium]